MKKLLSILLAVTMLFTCLTVAVTAEGETEETPAPALSFEVTGSRSLAKTISASSALFSYDLEIDSSKICAFDGESKAYTYEMKSLIANDIDYMTDPDAFFAAFESEEYTGTTLYVTFVINFESDKVFGTLDYSFDVTGFLQPLEIGFGAVDDALSNVALPVDVSIEGNVWEFPSVDASSLLVTQRPTKQDYLDTEKFDFTGTTISLGTKVATSQNVNAQTGEVTYTYEPGYSGTVTYGPDNANMFTTNPDKNENLCIHSTEVIAYFDGNEIAKLPVSVDHAWSNGYVSITTDKYTESKPGYHAILCDGCGEAHDAQPHTPAPLLDEEGNVMYDEEGNEVCWTYNNDQTFTSNGTESATCIDCGATLTRDVFSSADYNDAFANYHFLRVIFDYINTLLRLIGAAGVN